MSHDSIYLPIPIGVDDYKKLIDEKKAYVDKTLFIKEFWQDGSEVVLIPRPRRFGKTLNLSMLRYFFEKTNKDTSYLFEKTAIWNVSEYRDLQGQFPVIFLTLKDVKVDSWESAYEEFAIIISEECKRLSHYIIIEKVDASDIDIFNKLKNKQASEGELTQSLRFLSRLLYEQTEKKVILLIDEYDAPIINAYLHHYYQKMVVFMRNLFSKALKSNPALKKGCLTGITRIAKKDIFSGLNHLSVYTVLNIEYSDKFGFTQEEVDLLLANYDLVDKKNEIKSWYDGYIFGQTNIYNPWSLLKCIKSIGDFQTYWANTSDNKLVKNIIANANQETKDEIRLLLQDNVIADKKIDESVTLFDLNKKNQEPWSFLLFTGYLTTISRTIISGRHYYTLAIPNKEISYLYQDLVLEALNTTISFAKLNKLFEAFMAGDQKTVEQCLQEFVTEACSYHDLSKKDPELSIHMLVLGLLAGLSDRYLIQSNRESGDGGYDVMLKPKQSQDSGILIEFKRAAGDDNATLVAKAQEALKQIKKFNYTAQMRTDGYHGPIFCYGIATHGKHVVVNMEIIPATPNNMLKSTN